MSAKWDGWGIRKMANHYAATLNTPPDSAGVHRSPIFGTSTNIMLVATVKFGESAVQKAFAKALKEAGDKLK